MNFCPICQCGDTETFEVNKDSSLYRYCLGCKSFYLLDTSHMNRADYSNPCELYLNKESFQRYINAFNYFRSTFTFNIGKKKGSFLEIGFCNPALLVMLDDEGWKTTGIDMTTCEKMEKIFKQTNVNFINSDVLEVELDEQFDLIWASHVIEHFDIKDMLDLLTRMRSWVKDTGVIFISSPDAGLRDSPVFHTLLDTFKPDEHYSIFSESAFLKLARSCGLRRIWHQVSHGPNKFQTNGEWRMCFRKS